MKYALSDRMDYRIAGYKGAVGVSGYAILLPPPFHTLRFCVRLESPGRWGIDHYDSGLGVSGPMVDVFEEDKKRLAYMRKWQRQDRTIVAAVKWLHRYLRHTHKTGKLAAQMRHNGFGWCLEGSPLDIKHSFRGEP